MIRERGGFVTSPVWLADLLQQFDSLQRTGSGGVPAPSHAIVVVLAGVAQKHRVGWVGNQVENRLCAQVCADELGAMPMLPLIRSETTAPAQALHQQHGRQVARLGFALQPCNRRVVLRGSAK